MPHPEDNSDISLLKLLHNFQASIHLPLATKKKFKAAKNARYF